ncbi:MAG TPA: YdcH family protein [Thermodesulfobacteriota bacterium]|nr:YdcH family protein [Thermodesulfobacteriota bacterium]
MGDIMKEMEIIERLLEGDEEFKRLYFEHRRLDDTVKELEKKGTLSIDEELEVKRLKKTKLALKDKMEEKIRRIRKSF